jgi:hypothetical protein
MPIHKSKEVMLSTAAILDALKEEPISWADVFDDEPYPTPEDVSARNETILASETLAIEEARLRSIKEKEECMAEHKALLADWASQDYWRDNHCTCYKDMTEEEFEALTMQEYREMDEGICACYKKVKLDEHGAPEECRFFNSPAGCRDGDACLYKHVTRDPASMPCRFEASAVGCNPGFGRKCPYMHSKPQVDAPPPSEVLCRFDGRCHPPAGSTCLYKHSDSGWRSAPAPAWRSAAGGSSADTMCRFDGRCNPAPGKKCPFKHSKPSSGNKH